METIIKVFLCRILCQIQPYKWGWRKSFLYFVPVFFLAVIFYNCEKNDTYIPVYHYYTPDSINTDIMDDACKYILPFPVGRSYYVSQAFNCSRSHYGVFTYSVDFDMPIGSIITASRNGTVVWICESHYDYEKGMGNENLLVIRHDDDTYSRYIHLTRDGALVNTGDSITAGDTIALSGNSGLSDHPHLHFDVTSGCCDVNCQTIEFCFEELGGATIQSRKYYSRD